RNWAADPKVRVVRRLLTLLLVGCALSVGVRAAADGVWTDANIVTGLDLSGSIDAPDAQLQIDGIAMAIRSPEIMAAIRRGNHGRIGFAVFLWADGSYPVLVSWRLIGSPEDALAVSEEIIARMRAFLGSDRVTKLGALTDLSAAIDHGGAMLQSAP